MLFRKSIQKAALSAAKKKAPKTNGKETNGKDWINTVRVGDARDLSFLPNGSINVVVTSPPYFNAISYDSHVQTDGRENYRDKSKAQQDIGDYQRMMHNSFRELWRVVATGGFLCVVVGTCLAEVAGEKRHIPLPFRFVDMLESQGWDFWENIIWNKVTGGIPRFGVMLQHPYPGYYYPNLMTEHILVFRRPRSLTDEGLDFKIYADRSEEELKRNRIVIDAAVKKDIANNIWHIAPIDPGTAKRIGHPCPLPEEIPYRLIKLYSYRGATVLDPFCGSGQTLKVANALGRKWVGVDTQIKYVALCRKRVKEPLCLRAEQLTPSYIKMKSSF